MRFFLAFLCVVFFLACSNDKEFSKSQNQKEEIVQIEQDDEKTDLNDTNLPLPVEDGS